MIFDQTIIEATRALMEAHPEGVTFRQIYDAGFGSMSNPPSSDKIWAEVDRLCENNEGMLVRGANGLYSTPDLDEVARELDILDFIDSI